jgi:hypothetical protein
MEAMFASQLAGDRSMVLFELDALAMQAIHLQRPGEARQVADEVLDGRISGRTAAIGHIRRSRAFAQSGERARSLDALRRARALLSDGIGARDPAWTWWIDESEVVWQEAMVHASLDEWAAAIDLFRQAVDLRPPVRQRSGWGSLAHLLQADVAAGAWREAEADIGAVVAVAGEFGSERIATLLRRTAERIHRERGPSSTLSDAADDLLLLLRHPA